MTQMLQTSKCLLQVFVCFYNIHDLIVVRNQCDSSNISCHLSYNDANKTHASVPQYSVTVCVITHKLTTANCNKNTKYCDTSHRINSKDARGSHKNYFKKQATCHRARHAAHCMINTYTSYTTSSASQVARLIFEIHRN